MLALAASLRAAPPEYGYRIVHVYPHDRNAFTQGLEYRGGFLYEGTGLEGRSTVRKVKLETGEVLQEIHLAPVFFGEGITVINERIVELRGRRNPVSSTTRRLSGCFARSPIRAKVGGLLTMETDLHERWI